MRRRALAAAITVILAAALAAFAAPGAAAAGDRATLLAASLNGAQEVPGPGDPDGSGRAFVRLSGDQACFLLQWSRITAPVAAHIHVGRRGVAGPVVVLFFQGQLPDTLNAVAGCAPADPAVVDAVAASPRDYYVNIHTADFPGGAIRGQLHRSRHIDLDVPDQLTARLLGRNEVPPADPDGRGLAFVDTGRTRVCFALLWTDIGPPIFAHIHRGVAGVNGPVVVLFFDVPEPTGGAAAALPDTITAAAGCIGGQDAALLRDIRRHPSAYYVNVHNAEFPGGAIRGQLRRLHH
jgi:CHRD domain-containing protein